MQNEVATPSRDGAVRAWLMYGSVPVGVVAVGMMAGTYALYGIAPDLNMLVLGFCGAFLLYQADRAWFEAPEDRYNQPERVRWLAEHRSYVVGSSLLAGLAVAVLLPGIGSAALWWIAGLGAVGLLEVSPLLPRRGRLSAVRAMKPVVISGAWAVGAVVVPLVEAGAALDMAAAAGVAYRFLFVLPNVLIADWPDRQGDSRVGLQNITSGWSAGRLRATACLSLGVAVAGGAASVGFFGAPLLLLVDVLGPLILLGLSIRPFPASRWYYGFTIDAVMAWPLVTATCAWWL